MGRKFALGLGIVAGACFVASKKMTEEQRERIAMKIDKMILDGREKALEYDYYAREFIEENDFGGMKDRFVAKMKHHAEKSRSVEEALDSLKQATMDLKNHLEEAGRNLGDEMDDDNVEEPYGEDDDDWNDDIVINANADSAFGEAKKAGDENATVTFYPHNVK